MKEVKGQQQEIDIARHTVKLKYFTHFFNISNLFSLTTSSTDSHEIPFDSLKIFL